MSLLSIFVSRLTHMSITSKLIRTLFAEFKIKQPRWQMANEKKQMLNKSWIWNKHRNVWKWSAILWCNLYIALLNLELRISLLIQFNPRQSLQKSYVNVPLCQFDTSRIRPQKLVFNTNKNQVLVSRILETPFLRSNRTRNFTVFVFGWI